MFTKTDAKAICPKCKNPEATITERDEDKRIQMAKDGQLRIWCAICSVEWLMPIEDQKKIAARG
jgi:hypothetical protein